MAPKTLKHHRTSDSAYRFTFGVQTVTITRRFLPSRSLRVRVTSTTVSGTGEGNWSEHRDFTDMHQGDAAFHKQAVRFAEKWEERYCSAPAPKKETPAVSDDTTPEPAQDTDPQPTATQWEGGATMTPARAAELATERTGVQHVVGEDGRTLCRREVPEPPAQQYAVVRSDDPVTLNGRGLAAVAAAQAAAPRGPVLEGTVVGKILGTYTFRVRSVHPSRTGEMGKLLTGAATAVTEAQMTLHAARSTARTGHPVTDRERDDYVADLQIHTKYFRALLDAGYANDTTWDELVTLLKPLIDLARRNLPERREALGMADAAGRVHVQRDLVAAHLFLKATAGVRRFYEDEADQEGICPDCHETLDEVEEGPDAGQQTCPNGCDRL